MNRSKKLVFAFFVSAAIMSSKNLLHNNVHAAGFSPNPQSSAYTSNTNIFTKYGYKGQCTWFTYGRALEKLGIPLPSEFYGNAVDWWYANEKDHVYKYGTEPKPNSIVVWSGGNYGYGHVAFVESIEGNTIYFNEGNFSVRGAYDGTVKSLSKEEIKDRGNLHLKGYIYLNEKYSSSDTDKTPTNNTPPSTPSETDTKKGVVNLSSTNSSLNVRNSGSISSDILGTLKKGDTVSIVAAYGDWYKIKFNSSYGYVSSKYISTSTSDASSSTPSNTNNSSTSSATAPTLKSGTVNLNDKSSSLKFRSTPGGQVVGSLTYGTKVGILETSGSWYKVNINGTVGYISANYVSVSQTQVTADESSSAATSSVGKIGTVNLSNSSSTLNLRNTPWTGRVLSALPYGSKVEILDTSGRWYKVKVGSEIGYVHSDYIKL